MAVVKISELPNMGTVANNDILPIVDVSETETKKITKENLLTDIPAGELDLTNVTETTQINDADYLLISQGGTTKKIKKENTQFASGDEVVVSTTTPVDPDNELKLWVNPDEMANIGGGGGEKGIVLYSTTATEVINANNRNNGNITVLNAGQYYKFGIGYERVTGGLIGYTEFLFDKENFEDMEGIVTLKIDRMGTSMSSGTGQTDKYTLGHMIHSRNVYLRGSQHSLQPSGSLNFYSNDYRYTGEANVGGGQINSVGYTTTYYDDNGTITVNPVYPTIGEWDLYTDLQNTSFNANDIIITKIIGFKK